MFMPRKAARQVSEEQHTDHVIPSAVVVTPSHSHQSALNVDFDHHHVRLIIAPFVVESSGGQVRRVLVVWM